MTTQDLVDPTDNTNDIQTKTKKSFSTIQAFILVSLIASALFITLSVLTREIGYYLLAGSSLITLVFSVFTSRLKSPPFLVFLLALSYQLLILLLSAIVPSYLGIPYALISLLIAFVFTSIIPRSSIGDWVVTVGILGAIASIQLTLLAPLPQVTNDAISGAILIIAVLLLIKVSEMFSQGRIYASVRTKLLLSSLVLTLVPLIVLSSISSRFLQQSIQTQANESLRVAADQTRAAVDDFIQNRLDSISDEATLTAIIKYTDLPSNERANSAEESEMSSTLQSLQTKEKIYLPSYAILDLSGRNIYDTNRGSIGNSEAETDYFQNASATLTSYVSSVEFTSRESSGYIYFITPIKNENAVIKGFLRARYDARIFQSLLDKNVGLIGRRSYPILLDENGLRLADGFSPNSINHLIAPISQEKFDRLLENRRIPSAVALEDLVIPQTDLANALNATGEIQYYTANLEIGQRLVPHSGAMLASTKFPWSIAYLQDKSSLTASLSSQNRLSLLIATLMAALISVLVVIASNQLTKPILALTRTAEQVSAGDLTVQTKITTSDELGILGNTFNNMTRQLRDLIESLENRVLERTKQLAQQNTALQLRSRQLQTVADVARSIVSTRAVDSLLDLVTKLVSERFGFYHAGIFLKDEEGEYAVLRAANSRGGKRMLDRGHKLKVGQVGIVGYVTGTGDPRIATDVGEDAVFFNNPDLPETKSEMAIPLKLGESVIGALDVQSVDSDAFTNEDIALFTTLADQISVAIENANAYEISQRTLEELREVDRVKSQFLANMSHELRTPLNSVIGFSRVILKGIDGPINDTQEQDITAIYNSGMHLLNMINEILDMSKIEAGKMELQLEEKQVTELIENSILANQGLIKDKPIELRANIQPDLPNVKIDEVRINQVLTNLISNAVKFTEEGSITINASLQENLQGKEEILITIADTGIGIAPEDQSKLFQRFSQVDDSPTRRTGGTGLGLSICRSLVELHGGTIGLLKSEPGAGSEFYFTIPVEPKLKEISMDFPQENNRVVLSIDDDEQVIRLYERFLKPHGYTVVPLTDPTRAVERASELHPFAITLDVMMPEKDGWQVLNDLKTHEETRDIPVMICSILEEEEKGFSLGAADYLVKPFLHDDLANALQRINQNNDVHEIMIVDDDPEYLRLLQQIIEENGHYMPVIAEGGEAALKLLAEFTPDVIVMDLMLSDVNGFEMLEKIKQDSRLTNVPVIILTSTELDDEQKKLLSKYHDQIFDKWSIDKNTLLNNLQTNLDRIHKSSFEM